MNAEELRRLCEGIRPETYSVDDALVTTIESNVQEYRRFLAQPRPQLPPAELAELLPLMGWLILETSLDRLWKVDAGFEAQPGESGEVSRNAAALIARLADAARELPWPEFAPRALGAIRAQALVESKRDTETGYDAAWTLHQDARIKHQSFLGSHGRDSARDRFRLDLDEILLQLALAETGTACRTAEQIIGLWAEKWEKDDLASAKDDSQRWTQRMFSQLSEGAEIGERALEIAKRIENERKFVHDVSEFRLALVTSYRNPTIMTCRALLLMYSMCPEMDELRRIPPDGCDTWPQFQENLLQRFDRAVSYLRCEVTRKDGSPWSLLTDHARSIVQICLHLALLTTGHKLEEELVVDGTLTLDWLDDAAVESMSNWLAEVVNGKQRGDANVIGSASKRSFIKSVEECRKDAGVSADYRAWRRQWWKLDRYADREGRRERIQRILGADAQ
jgi:hypothetical protein